MKPLSFRPLDVCIFLALCILMASQILLWKKTLLYTTSLTSSSVRMGAHVVTDLAPQTTPVLETNAPQLPISIVGEVVSISSRKVTLRVAGSESSYDISGIQIVQRTPKSGRDLSDEMQAQNIEALKGSVTLPPVPFTEKNIDASEVKSGAHMDILFDTDHRATRVVVMQ